jgi:pyruvate/2-oxoglutarate dehydrogenase complex dihydrolipoamide acyltransferase (E2) component
MKEHNADAQVIPYSRVRQWTAAAYRSVQHKPMIHGLFEVDVTKARVYLRAHQARTGESLSFTAFLTACLAKAVDEHKEVQAVRQGSRRLVTFEEVDVWIPIEHEVAGKKQIVPHIVRAANRKTFYEIHREIRAAQVADVEQAVRGSRFLPAVLFGPAIWLFWRVGRGRPRLLKQSVGTVGLTAVGMFGKGAGWGVPPPIPTPLLLTVGGIDERQVLEDGHTALREYLSLAISVDHDIVDGAPAARFARRLSELIESGDGLDDSTIQLGPAGAEGASRQQEAFAPRARPWCFDRTWLYGLLSSSPNLPSSCQCLVALRQRASRHE